MKAITHTLIERGSYKIVFVEAIKRYALMEDDKTIAFYDSIRDASIVLKHKYALTKISKARLDSSSKEYPSGRDTNPASEVCKSGLVSQPHSCKLSRTIKRVKIK